MPWEKVIDDLFAIEEHSVEVAVFSALVAVMLATLSFAFYVYQEKTL